MSKTHRHGVGWPFQCELKLGRVKLAKVKAYLGEVIGVQIRGNISGLGRIKGRGSEGGI